MGDGAGGAGTTRSRDGGHAMTPKSASSSILAAQSVHGVGFDSRLRQMPVSMRPTYRRAMTGKSRKAGVKAFCQECMGWENIANSIRECTSHACPLYPYRPFQEATHA